MTLTLPCPQITAHDTDTTTEPPPAAADLRSAAAVRQAVSRVRIEGWDNPVGRALLDALATTCRRLAARVEASARVAHDPARPDDLLSHAWELINSNPDAVLAAANPWAYLTTCLRRTLTNTVIAGSLLVSPIAVRNGTTTRAGLRPPVRAGDHWTDLETSVGDSAAGGGGNLGWDVGLVRLHEHLVRLGAPASTTSLAIERISEIISEVRRGRRETAVATDAELAGLGLNRAQSRALLGLLIGARHDQGRSSLWLLLRDNAEMTTSSAGKCADRRVRAYLRPFQATDESAA